MEGNRLTPPPSPSPAAQKKTGWSCQTATCKCGEEKGQEQEGCLLCCAVLRCTGPPPTIGAAHGAAEQRGMQDGAGTGGGGPSAMDWQGRLRGGGGGRGGRGGGQDAW